MIKAELICMAVNENTWLAWMCMKIAEEDILQQFIAYESIVQAE